MTKMPTAADLAREATATAQHHARIDARIDHSGVRSENLRANLKHLLKNPASVPPLDPETGRKARQIELTQHGNETWVENFYREVAPGFLPVHLLFGADNRFRGIVAKALAEYDQIFAGTSDDTGITHTQNQRWWVELNCAPVAISTSRPGHRWLIDGTQTLDAVYETIQDDLWCDLDPIGNGGCVENLRDGKQHASSYYSAGAVPNSPHVLPFAQGNFVIFAHVCFRCWESYLKAEKIDRKQTQILHLYDDGFGVVGELIPRSEYRSKRT